MTPNSYGGAAPAPSPHQITPSEFLNIRNQTSAGGSVNQSTIDDDGGQGLQHYVDLHGTEDSESPVAGPTSPRTRSLARP